MKLFGNSRRAKHSSAELTAAKSSAAKKSGMSLPVRILLVFLSAVVVTSIGLVAYWKVAVKPPVIVAERINPNDTKADKSGDNPSHIGIEVNGENNDGQDSTDGNTDDLQNGSEASSGGDKYTFVVVGMDDGNWNTDTMMVGTFDTAEYTLDIVSIPRDTLVNVSWNVKKANTLYANGKEEGLKNGLAQLLGYKVGFYAVIDLDAFEKVIDAVGGVTYNVPINMNYEDPAQDLYIHLNKGTQTLNGKQAMQLMRFRSGYSDQDIGRIGTQQDFLKSMASQLLANVDEVPITTIADIVVNDVKTDLTYGNLIWFAKEFLKMDAENVNFYTLPGNYEDCVYQGTQYVSYVTIYVSEWVTMINDHLNPFDEPIEVSDLDILTRNSAGALYTTSGVFAGNPSWGSGKKN